MNKVYIKSISIQGFRGINNQSRPLFISFNTKGVTSIFAENGKGKSSIFEAIYYCLNNCFPRLDNLHREIRDEKSKRNLFYHGDGNIKINFIDEKGIEVEIAFSIDQNGERLIKHSSLSNPQAFLKKLECQHSFLDYNSFIKILLNSPEETGRLFSDLVGLSEFPYIKEKLDKISRSQNINNDFQKNSKENSIAQNKQAIAENRLIAISISNELGYTGNHYDEKKIYLFIRKLAKADFNTSLKSLIEIKSEDLIKNKAGDQYTESIRLLNSLDIEITTLQKHLKAIKDFELSKLQRLRKQLKTVYKQVKSLLDLFSRDLFDKAIKIYENTDYDPNSCVLCETNNLGNNKLSFFEQVQRKAAEFNDLNKGLAVVKHDLNIILEQGQFLQIEDYLAEKQLLRIEDKVLSQIYHSKDELKNFLFDQKIIESQIKSCRTLLLNKIKELSIQKKQLFHNVPKDLANLIDKSVKIKEVIDKIIDCRKMDLQVKKDEIYLNRLEEWTEFISQIKTDFEGSFNELMVNISRDINKTTKDFFYELMKNSEISPLIIKENKGQKVNILLDKFYTSDNKKASSLLSESYRNALCLSIYFASLLKRKSFANFIVLDDVCSSFDSGHQYFLLDLMRDKISHIASKNGKQIIFLTHDGLLKKALPKYSCDKWTHYSLSGNRSEMSVKPYTSDDFKNLLLNKINNGEHIGSDLRSFYESVLIEIIEKLNIQIPFNLITTNDKKLVNDLLNSLSDIVYLRVKARKTRIRNLPSKLEFKTYLQEVGNNLSHFASSSESSLSPSALTSLVNYMIQIRQRFQYRCTCSRNLGWVYYKSLEGGKNDKGCTCII